VGGWSLTVIGYVAWQWWTTGHAHCPLETFQARGIENCPWPTWLLWAWPLRCAGSGAGSSRGSERTHY